MYKKYAAVIVDISHESVDRPFTYRIKESLKDEITIGACVMVPFGRSNKLMKGYVVAFSDSADFPDEKIKEIEEIVIKQDDLQGRMIRLAAWIRKHYGSTMIQALKVVLPVKKTVKPIEKKTIVLAMEQQEAEQLLETCKAKSQKARVRLLEELIKERVLDYQLVRGKLNISPQTLSKLQQMGAITIEAQDYFRNPIVVEKSKEKDKELLPGQKEIVDDYTKDYREGVRRTYLLHGVTGSGKTEVYIRMIKEVVASGKQVIFLIPEIALTYQTVLRFYHHFGDRVSVVNSSLSYGERYDQFERAKRGELDVMIGPRSALFTPFADLGLIVIDEEHENSYKSESMPKYHAVEVAQELSKMCGASLVLGSATPSVDSYYRAQNGEYKLYSMQQRIEGSTLPVVHTIDLRQELKEGNRSIFSRKLQELIQDRLDKKEQIMLFLNRRGYAGFISCRSCGHVMKCPHCDISLSEHKNGKLVCHYCGYEEIKPPVCPKCGSKYLLGFRAGTQQIEEQLYQLFPGISVLRMDGDTTRQKDSYEKILSSFNEGDADVLVGTQMIVKGHDFPNVTLMGVIAADLSLAANDYRAGERTFALLTQAAGRAGRAGVPGEVVIQTYQPDHYSVAHAANQDYTGFYEEEILYRTFSSYPPVCKMLMVMVTGKDEERVEAVAKDMASCARDYSEDGILVGPAPAGIRKINDIYRQIFMIKAKEEDLLIGIKDLLESQPEWKNEKDISIMFDFNPVNPY
ncbi:MAG: primosomal protein N' [Lachnospiraceae bacterium]|nr:primosomal protein N' [Lachnospiraceae bacterium]